MALIVVVVVRVKHSGCSFSCGVSFSGEVLLISHCSSSSFLIVIVIIVVVVVMVVVMVFVVVVVIVIVIIIIIHRLMS